MKLSELGQYKRVTDLELRRKKEALLEEATLSLDFANNKYRVYEGLAGMSDKAFSDAVTFTRSSAGTGDTATGVIDSVGVDTPRLVGNREGLLIEEQRTRLNTIAAAPTSPENVTVTATAHTISFFGTGTVDLSGAYVGQLAGTGEGERVTLTFTPAAGTLTITPSGAVENLQLEEGSFETSVILGDGAQVTRAADNCSRALGAEFNADAWTAYIDFVLYSPITDFAAILYIQGAGYSDARGLRLAPSFVNIRDPDLTFNLNIGLDNSGAHKVAISFDGSNYTVCQDGIVVRDAAGGMMPGLYFMGLGKTIGGSVYAKHVHRDVKLFPRALSESELIALTTPEA